MSVNLDKIVVIGDRVLIEPTDASSRTKNGLYLPAGYHEKDEILQGYIVKCGPGYALPSMEDDESWNPSSREPRYIPLQAQPGDLALFVKKNAVEVKIDGERYFVAPQSALLLVERDAY